MKKTILPFLFLLFLMLYSFCQVIDAGESDTICSPVSVQLTATRDNYTTYFSQYWTPSSTLNNDTILNPVANPTATTTYYFSSYYEDDTNLVYNGDFELGSTGFISDYIMGTGSNGLYPEGTYAIVHYPGSVHSDFPNDLYDHTYGTNAGNFMAVNGAGVPNTNVWSQTVNVTPNTDYVFYTWVVTLVANTQTEVSQLQFSINGILIGSVFTAPYPASQGWGQFYQIWNSGSNTTALIKIVNQNTTLSGNDFGLDDIHFAPIIPAIDSVTIYVGATVTSHQTATVCDGSAYEFGEQLLTASGEYTNTLQTSLGCDSIVYLQLNFSDPVTVDLGNNRFFCTEDQSSFTLHPGNYENYLWSDGTTESTLTVSATGTYSVTVSDMMGCSATDSVTVEFRQNPQVSIQNNSGNFCETFSAELYAATDIASNFIWNTGETTQFITATSSGIYSVIADNGGCMNKAFYSIAPCEYYPYLPNCFTPGIYDGLNDYFRLSSPEGVESLEIYIFNRFGELVFCSFDPCFVWDGRCKGEIYTSATYSYVLKIVPKTGEKITLKGHVTVL